MAAFSIGCHLLPGRLFSCTSLAQQSRRSYALSRFPHRTTGFGRSSRGGAPRKSHPDSLSLEDRLWTSSDYEENSAGRSRFGGKGTPPTSGSEACLRRLLANNDELVITRQLEMLNIFMGFEQSNRYVISNSAGESLGYIAEEPRGFLSMFARQLFRTHRPFRALVMDLEGSPILWIRRPFSWINSRMFVQRPQDYLARTPEGELVLDTFAEVQQEWHLWRRKYNLFLRVSYLLRLFSNIEDAISFSANLVIFDDVHPLIFRSVSLQVYTSIDGEPQPEAIASDVHFNQFARVDEGLWAWRFVLRGAHGDGFASVSRAFRGFGREIFTDTGQYTVSFHAPDEQIYSSNQSSEVILHQSNKPRNLSVDERALVLAMAINIDYDYFSRHSDGGHGFGFWWSSGE